MGTRITHRLQRTGCYWHPPVVFRFRVAADGCRWWADTIDGVVPIVIRAGGATAWHRPRGRLIPLLRGISIGRDHVAYPHMSMERPRRVERSEAGDAVARLISGPVRVG